MNEPPKGASTWHQNRNLAEETPQHHGTQSVQSRQKLGSMCVNGVATWGRTGDAATQGRSSVYMVVHGVPKDGHQYLASLSLVLVSNKRASRTPLIRGASIVSPLGYQHQSEQQTKTNLNSCTLKRQCMNANSSNISTPFHRSATPSPSWLDGFLLPRRSPL